MTVADAIESFKEKAQLGKVYNARTGEFTATTVGTVNQILHTIRRAARRAGGTADLATVPYVAVANMLDEHAKEDAIESGEGNGTNEANRARRFVRTVEGTVAMRRRSYGYNFLLEWQPLCDAADRLANRKGKESRRSYLHGLMELASAKGRIQTPEGLPDRNTLKRWAEESGISSSSFNKWLSTYRSVRAEIAREDADHGLPDIDLVPVDDERGVRSLPCIVNVAERVGHEGPLSGLDIMTALEQIAPMMHGALAHYLDHCRASGLSAEWERGVIGAVSRVVASAVRVGREGVEEMLPTDLFLERIGVEEEVREDEIPAYLRKMRERSGRAPVETRQVRRVSLLQFLMEEMAHGAADNSPTMLKKATQSGLKEGEVPFFPPIFVVEISRLTALARFVLEQDREATLEQTAGIDITKKAVLAHMVSVNKKRGVVGRRLDKDRSLNLAGTVRNFV